MPTNFENHKSCGGMQSWGRLLQFNEVSLKSSLPQRPSRCQRISDTLSRSPRKSLRLASRELGHSKSTAHDVLHKRLKLYAYKLQLIHEVKPDDKPKRTMFAEDILQRIAKENNFLSKVMFSDVNISSQWEGK